MSFFKSYDSLRIFKGPIGPTDTGYETNSPMPPSGKKKRTVFGKQLGVVSRDVLNRLPDFQTPSWFGRFNKSSWLGIQPGEYSRTKSIKQRFDGACDEPKRPLSTTTLPSGKRCTSNPELRNINALHGKNRCMSVPKSHFDGSSDLSPAASIIPRRTDRSSSSEGRPQPSLKKFQSSDSVRSSSSFRSLDRFLPRRTTANSASTSFRANKDPHSLSPEEKLLRHSGASVDAFSPRRRATSPTPQPIRITTRRNISANRSGGASTQTTCYLLLE